MWVGRRIFAKPRSCSPRRKCQCWLLTTSAVFLPIENVAETRALTLSALPCHRSIHPCMPSAACFRLWRANAHDIALLCPWMVYHCLGELSGRAATGLPPTHPKRARLWRGTSTSTDRVAYRADAATPDDEIALDDLCWMQAKRRSALLRVFSLCFCAVLLSPLLEIKARSFGLVEKLIRIQVKRASEWGEALAKVRETADDDHTIAAS